MSYIVLFWVVSIVIGLMVIGYASLSEKKRRGALAELAAELGLGFAQQLDGDDRRAFDTFQLAQQGRARQVKNVIIADSGELRMVLFDYQYKTGSGKSTTVHRQSVVLVCSSTLALPSFSIAPERFFHRLLGVFGSKDIDFDEDPEFSQRFLLEGANEAAVRSFFHAARRNAFAEHADLCLECRGQWFVTYRRRHRWDPAGVKTAMEKTFQLVRLLSDD